MEKQFASGDKHLAALFRQWQPRQMKDRNWTSANYFWWRIQREQRDRRQTYDWLRPTWTHKKISKRASMLTRHKGWRNRDGGSAYGLDLFGHQKPLQHARDDAERPYGDSHCDWKRRKLFGGSRMVWTWNKCMVDPYLCIQTIYVPSKATKTLMLVGSTLENSQKQ